MNRERIMETDFLGSRPAARASIPMVHNPGARAPNRNNNENNATTELYTKSKAFLQDTLVNSNSSSMKPQQISSSGDRSASSPSSPDSKPCHIFHAFSKCFRFCSKPKDYSDCHKSGGEMDEGCSFELSDTSEILTVTDVNLLGQRLPPIAIGNTWKLTFSTTRDGFCLKSLYRKMLGCPGDSPVLLIIQDTLNRVFGVLASDALRISDHFYGRSQSFLFQIVPAFQVYKWNGDNFYFIKGNPDSILFGSGDGNPGLWLDGDLNKGRTSTCKTFGSPPLVPEEDFIIKTLECWTFVRQRADGAERKISSGGDSFWNHIYTSEPSLVPMDKDRGDEIRERKVSLTSKAEQLIVSDYVIKLTDELKSAIHSQDPGEFHPELIIGTSSILDFDDVINVGKNLNLQCSWYLSFSTLLNGRSLDTLYNRTSHVVGSTLILIKTEDKRVFGALLSDPPRSSSGYYGTAQTFLFTCRPSFQVYRWTGKDHQFICGSFDYLKIGAADNSGVPALLLNSTLTEGLTAECTTFGNKPVVPEGTFKIKILECWHFGAGHSI